MIRFHAGALMKLFALSSFIQILARQTVVVGSLALLTTSTQAADDDWKANAISPVTNPVFFEDPHIHSEVRPIFMYHNIHPKFVTQGGSAQLYAMQLRWAVTDRFALIATKDGYVDFKPDAALPRRSGWADLAFGFKYALIDNREAEFILTPGYTVEIPTGNSRVLQGNGSGTSNPFISAAKGFGDLRFTGNVGGIIPHDFSAESAQIHYSVQTDYTVHQYFTPFAALNVFTVVSEAKGLPLSVEGFDLFNFGASNASGFTQAVAGVGFRSRLTDGLYLGFAYELPVTSPRGLFGDRFTVDLIWRF
jgi:hypothetical protein